MELDFDGYAIGGVSVGEPEEEMMRAVESGGTVFACGQTALRYGTRHAPANAGNGRARMDMFDCVLPTRLARNGTAFTAAGTLNLKNAEFAMDKRSIEENCACPRLPGIHARLHSPLIKAEEILGLRLVTLQICTSI